MISSSALQNFSNSALQDFFLVLAKILLVVGLPVVAWFVIRRLIEREGGRRDKWENEDPMFEATTIADEFFIVVRVFISAIILLFALLGTGLIQFSSLISIVGSGIIVFIFFPLIAALVNGILIKYYRLVRKGDVIEDLEAGRKGVVTDISLLYTRLLTFDYEKFRLLNYQIRNADIVNYTRQSKIRRVHIDVPITYETEIEDAQQTIERILDEDDGVLKSDGINESDLESSVDQNSEGEKIVSVGSGGTEIPVNPDCRVERFGDSGVLLRTYFWVMEPCKLSALKARLREEIIITFKDLDIEIAYPHTEILFKEDSNTVSVDLELFD